MAYQSINPFNGKLLQTFTGLTDVELESKLVTANSCFESWRLKSFSLRAKVVARAAAIMRERIEELARLATIEMGKLIGRLVVKCCSALKYLTTTRIMPNAFLLPNISLQPRVKQK